MIWLYLLSGALALYSVETADANQPFHITAMVALLLCLIPSSIEATLHRQRPDNSEKNLIANPED